MADTTKTAEYDVTERAGKRVAGRVVEKGKPLLLTEAEAEHGLRDGTLVPKGKDLPKAWTEDTKQLAGMRADADALRGRAVAAQDPEAAPEAPPQKSAAPATARSAAASAT